MAGGGIQTGATQTNVPTGTYYQNAQGEMVPYTGTNSAAVMPLARIFSNQPTSTPILYTKNAQGYWAPYYGTEARPQTRAPIDQSAAIAAAKNMQGAYANYGAQLSQSPLPVQGTQSGAIANAMRQGYARANPSAGAPLFVQPGYTGVPSRDLDQG